MRKPSIFVSLPIVLLGLAACTDDDGSRRTQVSQAQPEVPVTESACLAAVANETGEGDVSVLSSEYSEANSVVMVGVGPQRAPWRCLVSKDGFVAEVSFTGDEGKL